MSFPGKLVQAHDLPEHVPTHRQPWERNTSESDLDWQAFQAYREVGYPNGYDQKFHPRDLKGVAIALGRPYTAIKAAAATHAWHDRSGAFDAFLDRRRTEQGLSYHARTQYAQARALDKMFAAWEACLDQFQAKVDCGDGLTAREIAQWGDIIIKNQRLISGQSTENVSVKHSMDLMRFTDVQARIFERLCLIAMGSKEQMDDRAFTEFLDNG